MPDQGQGKDNLTAEQHNKEISASTIGRMLGLATSSELKLVESQLELAVTKLSTLMVKVEKALTLLGNCPNGSDLERIDVQIGSLRTLIVESMASIGANATAKPAPSAGSAGQVKSSNNAT